VTAHTASPGSLIAQSNCHPFKFGKYVCIQFVVVVIIISELCGILRHGSLACRLMFMHNGGIAHFDQIKYSILHSIQHTSACYIRGNSFSLPDSFVRLASLRSCHNYTRHDR
jgi:predicted glutamine amidotransferase